MAVYICLFTWVLVITSTAPYVAFYRRPDVKSGVCVVDHPHLDAYTKAVTVLWFDVPNATMIAALAAVLRALWLRKRSRNQRAVSASVPTSNQNLNYSGQRFNSAFNCAGERSRRETT